LDSDPGRKKLFTTTRKEKSEKVSCVKVLGVLFGGLNDFALA
jgi:hypothetical protein